MTVEIDERRYAKLLARALPHVITTESENEEVLERVRELMIRGDSRTPEEDALLELLAALVEKFEAERYHIPKAAPHEILAFMLEQHGLRPVDLLSIFGSRGHVSDVLKGRRAITAAKARQLGEHFGVDPGLFI